MRYIYIYIFLFYIYIYIYGITIHTFPSLSRSQDKAQELQNAGGAARIENGSFQARAGSQLKVGPLMRVFSFVSFVECFGPRHWWTVQPSSVSRQPVSANLPNLSVVWFLGCTRATALEVVKAKGQGFGIKWIDCFWTNLILWPLTDDVTGIRQNKWHLTVSHVIVMLMLRICMTPNRTHIH